MSLTHRDLSIEIQTRHLQSTCDGLNSDRINLSLYLRSTKKTVYGSHIRGSKMIDEFVRNLAHLCFIKKVAKQE
jgi:hypothetical protein